MVKLPLSEKQYKHLLELVGLGNWVMNTVREDESGEVYESLEKYLLEFSEKEKLTDFYERKSFRGESFLINKYDTPNWETEIMEEYNNEQMFTELAVRLAKRDMEERGIEYGIFSETGKSLGLSHEEISKRMKQSDVFYERYNEEFEEHGISRLYIRQAPFA